jgi:hypothetical protein
MSDRRRSENVADGNVEAGEQDAGRAAAGLEVAMTAIALAAQHEDANQFLPGIDNPVFSRGKRWAISQAGSADRRGLEGFVLVVESTATMVDSSTRL